MWIRLKKGALNVRMSELFTNKYKLEVLMSRVPYFLNAAIWNVTINGLKIEYLQPIFYYISLKSFITFIL